MLIISCEECDLCQIEPRYVLVGENSCYLCNAIISSGGIVGGGLNSLNEEIRIEESYSNYSIYVRKENEYYG